MLILYSMQRSGNAYKPRLLMALLGIPFRIVEVNTYDGSTRQPEFLAKNPIGKVPLLEFPDGRRLAESNAILLHLAEETDEGVLGDVGGRIGIPGGGQGHAVDSSLVLVEDGLHVDGDASLDVRCDLQLDRADAVDGDHPS